MFLHFRWSCREDAERDARLAAEDRIRDLQAQVSELRADLAASRLETVRASERVADFFAARFMGRAIFDPETGAVKMPDESGIPKARVQARQIVQQRTAEAEAELAEFARRRAADAAASQD